MLIRDPVAREQSMRVFQDSVLLLCETPRFYGVWFLLQLLMAKLHQVSFRSCFVVPAFFLNEVNLSTASVDVC